MLPGTVVPSLDELTALPHHSVVLRRSDVQPYFRTAWTLTIMFRERTWHSSNWRAVLTDEDMFNGAQEPIIVLYKPIEQFGIGSLREGRVDTEESVTGHASLAAESH